MNKLVSHLFIEYKPTNDLVPDLRRTMVYSEKAIRDLADNIERFGFNKPLIVDSCNRVIAGNRRHLAAHELGMNSVPCIIKDGLPNNYREIDDLIHLMN